jgi:uncharacterized protein
MLAKPAGARCNLECKYCFYRPKSDLYPGSHFKMSNEVLENYTRQLIESHMSGDVTFSWQGGEPTLMGLDFFKEAIEMQKKYCKPGTIISNTIQTNGMLLDDRWCSFLAENKFLVGISIDGPAELHDENRVDASGRGSHRKVMKGLRLLQEHKVDVNALTTVNSANGNHPVEVYEFLRDDAGLQFIQLIPIVVTDPNEKGSVMKYSIKPDEWGRFLITVFDEWVRNDVGSVFVQMFEEALVHWIGMPPSMCVFSPTCGTAPILEHNGDVYSCDHFVDPSHLRGNIMNAEMACIVGDDRQIEFGLNKRGGLPKLCRDCEVFFACYGGCPKNRLTKTEEDGKFLNYLCEGYSDFFRHIDEPMGFMANALIHDRAPSSVMEYMRNSDRRSGV